MRFILLLCIVSCYSIAQTPADTIKSYTTARLEGEAPKIDGYLNDPAWEQVPWGGGDFRQVNPDAGKPASVQTKFKILYDAKNLYIAFLNLDPEPSKIVKRMSRRDGFEGDWVEINIDSYFDKRTAFSFTSSVSGVKGDEYVSNNGDNWDESWDPIWYLKTSVNDEGWIAEVRIPLSQLRFAEKPELTWGFQITRRFFRKQERSLFQYIAPDAAGWVHLFAELRGIKGIKPQKQLEIQPYVVAKTERFQKEEGNPFATGKSSSIDGGIDAKIGITSDVTLDLTVNPDFGQVEADPSQVNLTAFELFFQERRPFFIEGNNTLNFPISDFNDDNLFYSRRIGRKPQGEVNTDETGDDGVNEYVKTANKTTILGAAKLTGKNKKGFSWGVLETVTALEKATIDSLGFRRKQAIEPLTNYFVGRAQQDINKGNTIIGGMFTATNRDIEDKRLDWLHRDAYSGGIDFIHNWKSRTYYVNAKTLFSYVSGSPDAIINTQMASERYFQRPDNNHAHVDSLRNSLSGTGGKLVFGKKSGKLVFDVGLNWMSPQLELNDVGFLLQTDKVKQWVWMQYRILTQSGIFRSQSYDIQQVSNWDFDRRNTSTFYNTSTFLEFKNYWQMGTGVTYETHNISNADLRGGPSLRYPGSTEFWFYLGTDNRKKLRINLNPYWTWGRENYVKNSALEMNFVYRPLNALNITISPSINYNQSQLQYVTTSQVNNENRYIVAAIDQTVARISLRMTYMVTPNLSLQYWGQPFGASGTYSDFKYVTDAKAENYSSRFIHLPSDWVKLSDDGQYSIDENKDGIADVTFDKPDFSFGQFKSNAVVRWEYIPGSTLFLVWTQERNGAFYDGTDSQHDKYSFDFSQQKAHSVFLIKYTYRFVL